MGDITELGRIVSRCVAQPQLAGRGEQLRWSAIFWSFNEVLTTLNRQGHKFSFKQVRGKFLPLVPGAGHRGNARLLRAYTYLGSTRARRSRSPTKWLLLTNEVRGVGQGEFRGLRTA